MNPSRHLRNKLNQYAEIPDREYEFFEKQLTWRKVSKGEYLLNTGEVCSEIYYCARGIIRLFYTTADGVDFNKSLNTENSFVTAYSSVLLGIPSYQSIQALEDSEIAIFTKAVLDQLYDRHHSWERLGRKLAEALYVKKEMKERQFLLHSPETRYQIFLQEFPSLEHRIQQYHIASYLGISPVSLSRIKKRIKG